MDNASYYSVQTDKCPAPNTRKAEVLVNAGEKKALSAEIYKLFHENRFVIALENVKVQISQQGPIVASEGYMLFAVVVYKMLENCHIHQSLQHDIKQYFINVN